jgi:hypothetical protein
MPTGRINVTVTNEANVGGADDYNQGPGDNTNPFFPPVFFGDNFTITTTPQLIFEDYEFPTSPTNLSVSTSVYFSYNDLGTTIQITNGTQSPFNDYYEFLMKDMTYQILEPNDARSQGFLAIVKWVPPTVDFVTVTHNFTISYSGGSVPVVKYQNIYFKYEPYINEVKSLVSEGVY